MSHLRSDGVYVIEEELGNCRACGKRRDLRYGYCEACAPPEVRARILAEIRRAKAVVVRGRRA